MPKSTPPKQKLSLFSELRHRGVVQVGLVYAVVGWTLIEIADALFPPLGIPAWALSLVVALVLLGFPLALVLAWAYERTPAGVRRAPSASGRRTATALAAGLAVALFAAAVVLDLPSRRAPRTYGSLAVLPFQDLSREDQSYFSEGVAEELMTLLASVPGLDVVGRASAFAFRERGLALDQAAEKLGVELLVDGSVRREGEDLRIAVQLIEVASGRVVWSRRYNRTAGDIFALQDQIATAVAGEVGTRLATPPPQSTSPERLRAHDLYLQGLSAWHRRTPADVQEAARLFERAVAADTTYARAHAGVALAQVILPLLSDYPLETAAARASTAAARALALDPTLAEAHAALSQRALNLTWDRATAVSEARRAVELRPSYATGWQWYAEALLVSGRVGEALDAVDRAIELDPLAPAPRNIKGAVLYASGRSEDGLREVREALARFPGVPLFANALVAVGFCEADTALVLEGVPGTWPAFPEATLPLVLAAMRSPARSAERRERLRAAEASVPGGAPSQVALLAAGLGEPDLAIEAVQRVVQRKRDPSLLYMLSMPCLARLQREPRFQAILQQLPEGAR